MLTINPPNKKSTKVARPQFQQPRGRPQPFKPGVAQTKNTVSAQSVKRPVAPPVYRPHSKPNAVQQKNAVKQKTAHPSSVKAHPSAPPVYRPQPTPKVLQAKAAGGPQPWAVGERRPVAPPVYRPETNKVAQAKTAAGAQPRTGPGLNGRALAQPVRQGPGQARPTPEARGAATGITHGLKNQMDVTGARAFQVGRGSLQMKAAGSGQPEQTQLPVAPAHRRVLPGGGSRFPIQRLVMHDEKKACLRDVKQYIADKGLQVDLSDDELDGELDAESYKMDSITIQQFLVRIGAVVVESKAEKMDVEWDPADEAEDPMDPDDILSSDVRKALSFNVKAKAFMKIDTPQDKFGNYYCHICGKQIVKGDKVDMDHLPPWKERLVAFIGFKGLTVNDQDELTGPLMSGLYNLRGSVFAHSSCNRGHQGEGNYKKKWGNALKWLINDGGPPF